MPSDASDALTPGRASDGARATDKAAIATDNISIDQPTDTVEEEAWTV
jgi:hypothetical protein